MLTHCMSLYLVKAIVLLINISLASAKLLTSIHTIFALNNLNPRTPI